MVLLRSLVSVASVASLVNSQAARAPIDPQSVDQGQRDQWCVSQQASCPLLCLQYPDASETPITNDCWTDTLEYSCVCDNNKSPNASEYSQTIPYFICTEQNNRCVNECAQTDASCQTQCRTDNPCGAQNPTRVNTTSTTAGTSATDTAASTTTSLAPFTGLPEDDDDEGAATRPMTDLTQVYGLFVVLGGFFAGFAVLL
ncbi:hypothetical protein BJY04DRAFT_216107 [Aspergillus karnatakaensis]|uniref:uncharacterized protein n=1 Tax=Aspergillus karnatakaensis TaxID=1810916 RepID=UPI003CCD1B8F